MRELSLGRKAIASFMSLCMALTMCIGIAPLTAHAASDSFRNLYIREADDPTMDSYVDASVGGYVYRQRSGGSNNYDGVNGVSMPEMSNVWGSRYAGEIWADNTVFAHYNTSVAQIRPFDEGVAYTESDFVGLRRPAGVEAGKPLTASQARELNDSANSLMASSTRYKYTSDGDFDGTTLQLGQHTDGVNSTVDIKDDSDFLNVFSVLASSEVANDRIQLPLDVVFVLDTSSTMSSSWGAKDRLYKASEALNKGIAAVMTNPNNRVALWAYDTNAENYLPLDHYEPMDNAEGEEGKYLIGSNLYDNNTFLPENGSTTVRNWDSSRNHRAQWIQLNAKSSTSGQEYDEWFSVHSGTNTHQGLYEGLNTLYEEMTTKSTIVTATGELEVQRMPVVILLSDGEPSYVTTSASDAVRGPTSSNSAQPTGTISDWWEPSNPDFQSAEAADRHNLIGIPVDDSLGCAIPLYFMAAHMKQKVNDHYFGSTTPTDYPGVQIITIAVDTESAQNDNRENLMRAALNPSEWMTQDRYDNLYESASESNNKYLNVKQIFESIKEYFETPADQDVPIVIDVYKNTANLKHAPQGAGSGVYDINWDTIKYNDQYLDVTADDLGEALTKLMADLSILGEIFVPVSGTNASGISDAVTYSNPIGNYMHVDDVTDLTMFGEHYTVNKRVVYDYATNEEILKQPENRQSNPEFIIEGWYSKQYADDGTVTYKRENGTVDDVANWEKGWTYYVTFATAQSFIPTLGTTTKANLTEKQKNTAYTIYTITEQYAKDGEWTVNKYKPTTKVSAANDAADTRKRTNPSYDNGENTDQVTFDLRDDIKIWVEDTGDYHDEATSDFIIDSGYSEALYVNVSNDALPVQMVTIDLLEGELYSYQTNIHDTWKSTPLRIFYDTSFDPDYLRYEDIEAERAQDKSKATGVGISDIDGKYLTANTGSDFIVNGKQSDNRYTAFYSNYFTNSVYTGYPILPDESSLTTSGEDTVGVSRGNGVVSFAAGPDNQFYRFQKNRILLLIPGSYGLNSRPAEIDLGDMKGVYISDDRKSVSDKAQEGYHECDPTNMEDLVVVLNDYRKTSGPNGTPSTYWGLGDCIMVDGGDVVENYDSVFSERAEEAVALGLTDWVQTANTLKNEFEERLSQDGLLYQPQINSNNWYYIVREYYVPGKVDSEGTGSDVQIHYMAIARKGNELGSGLANTNDMGAMVEWYHPISRADTNVMPFDSANANGHWGYPESDGNVEYVDPGDPSKGHYHIGGWYVSAKPGGLRVGGMSNFVGTKGYNIREGADQTDFTKSPAAIAAANTTDRALTYFVPAVSTYTGDDSDAVINLYLGNNGRILVDETLLTVTKLVKDGTASATESDEEDDTSYILDDDTDFLYDVKIDGFVGNRSAVKVIYDSVAKSWRRVVSSIDAVTNNSGLLYTAGGTDTLARVNERGVYDENGGYYVYIPPSTTSRASGNIYSYDGVNVTNGIKYETTIDGKAAIEFFAPVVYLIPVSSYSSGWSFSDSGSYTKIESAPGTGGAAPTGFLFATLDPDYDGNTSGTAVMLNSNYNLNGSYLSESGIAFDNDNTATILLKSGEGLIFNGISNGAKYTITEIISEDQDKQGWLFGSANGKTESGSDDEYTYSFDNATHTYAVSGSTGLDEDFIDYVNLRNFDPPTLIEDEPGSLNVTKTVTGITGETAREFNFTVTLEDDTVTGTFGGMTFENGKASFTLKNNQKITASGLPIGVSYTVTEQEANQEDYVTTVTGATGTISDMGSVTAAFVNDRGDLPGSLVVDKTVTGNAGELDRAFNFSVVMDDESIDGKFGGMTFDNGVATFTLMNGENAVATDLPFNVTYTVYEQEANQDGYTTTVDGDTGAISEEGSVKASFTNNRDQAPATDLLSSILRTGDNMNLGLWVTVLGAIALLALAIAFIARNKRLLLAPKGKHSR